MNLTEIRLESFSLHRSVNHYYDCKQYSVHLQDVVDIAEKFIHLIDSKYHDTIFKACYLHDTIEDCRVTYSYIKQIAGEDVAEIVYRCTQEKGKTRKERQSDKYYRGLKESKLATFVKVCDRIANTQYSFDMKDTSKLKMYQKEMDKFISELYIDEFKEMFEYLKSIKQ